MVKTKQFSESDWKTFQRKIAIWQERHMEKLVKEYISMLTGEGEASDKFWELEKRIKKDRRSSGVVCEVKRSAMFQIIWELLVEKIIDTGDLKEFSDDLKETVMHFYDM